MSEFAFFRFKSNNMLDVEEEQSEEQLREILEEDLGRKGKRQVTYNKGSTMAKKGEEEGEQREEVQYIR